MTMSRLAGWKTAKRRDTGTHENLNVTSFTVRSATTFTEITAKNPDGEEVDILPILGLSSVESNSPDFYHVELGWEIVKIILEGSIITR